MAMIDPTFGYWRDDSAEILNDAFGFAQECYGAALDRVDQPYVQQCLAIAKTLHQLSLDRDTQVAGLLYGVRPNSAHYADIGPRFGETVTNLLANLAKFDIYTAESQSDNLKTLETIRRALLTIVDGDVRVVLLRLAIALEELRAAAALPDDHPHKQQVALEVRNIYAPLANRLGIWAIKWEMEDRSFRILEPESYYAIAAAMAERREDRQKRIDRAMVVLGEAVADVGIVADIAGRPKHIYSIHRKMERKGVGLDRIYDAQALRVIIDQDEPEREDLSDAERRKARYDKCYQVLGIVHSTWEPIPSEFDDYIQHPKPNGYQSLHTAVHDEDGVILEVQIRTQRMHEEGERGIAAHWAYKEGSSRASGQLSRQIVSLRNLLGTIQAKEDGDAAAESAGEELLAERVYVFTPNGDVIDLPLGATPIDFAYAIHTQVGHTTRGAKVNGKMVTLTYKLTSGDKIEIVREKSGKPSRDWMTNVNYVATTRARSRIRSWFRKHEREQNVEFGRQAVEREIKQAGLADRVNVSDVCEQLKEPNEDEFLAKVGFGDISIAQIEGALILIQRARREQLELEQALANEEDEAEEATTIVPERRPQPKGITVMGMGGLHTTFAQCCNPIPPEPIVGFITRGRGATIHAERCTQIVSRQERGDTERIVSADWGVEKGSYAVPFSIKALRTSGLLEKIANILKGQNINLLKTKSTNSRRYTHIFIQAEVVSVEQAEWIRNRLLKMDNVLEVRSR